MAYKKTSMPVRCQRCGHIWDYSGRKKLITSYVPTVSCPVCKTSVKLREYISVDAEQ